MYTNQFKGACSTDYGPPMRKVTTSHLKYKANPSITADRMSPDQKNTHGKTISL